MKLKIEYSGTPLSDLHYQIISQAGCQLLFNPDQVTPDSADWLVKGIYQQAEGVEPVTHGGRGSAWFVALDGVEGVLRAYHRGGLLAKINRKSYLGFDVHRSRAFQEWHVLDHLHQQGLPVPRPLAASICRWPMSLSPFYRARILVERIAGAVTLDQWLSERPLSLELWGAIGNCIAQFHRKGVYHADLNANNILIDSSQKVYLIDFDKADLRCTDSVFEDWMQANLDRLQRSLIKQQGLHDSYHFEQLGWQVLMGAYQEGG